MALSFASKDTCYVSLLVSKFFSVIPPLLLSNNKAAVYISKDCGTRKEHCHINREFHTINKLLYPNIVWLDWISTNNQLANIHQGAWLEEGQRVRHSHRLALLAWHFGKYRGDNMR
jgi:hypothetical protein